MNQLMKAESSLSSKVTCWAKSTQGKVNTFLDEYLINFPVKSVRETTRAFLNSLFKKGNKVQKQNMLRLIKERILNISSMGNSSAEFLMLIKNIFRSQVQNKNIQKKQVFSLILQKGSQILQNAIKNQNYNFYTYLTNNIQFSTPIQPYLIESSGCMKCYGRTEFVYEQKDFRDIVKQTKAHVSRVQLVFNRIYSVKQLKINLNKKKSSYKTVQISYRNQQGVIKPFGGKYTNYDAIPSIQFSGSALIFDFDLPKSKRHIICTMCQNGMNADEYCVICSVCFNKFMEIQGSFKVIGADQLNLQNQLCTKYSQLNNKKKQLLEMYQDFINKRPMLSPNNQIIQQMQIIYAAIMKNLQLLKTNKEKSKNNFEFKQCKDCFSCNINQIQNIINFFDQNLQFEDSQLSESHKQFTPQQIDILLAKFKQILKLNKLTQSKNKIYEIIANLILFKSLTSINYEQQTKDFGSEQVLQILYEIIKIVKRKQLKLKQTQQFKFDWETLALFLNSNKFSSKWSDDQKIKIIVGYFIPSQLVWLLDEIQIQKTQLSDIHRLDIKQLKKLQNVCDFKIEKIIKKQLTNEIKIFLNLLPESHVPQFNLQVHDAQFLDYIKPVIPIITDELIYSNIVYTPHPILKLNMFSTLPELIKYVSLEQSMKLLTDLSKYNSLWNLNLKQTFKNFQNILNKQENQRKLILSLEGYQLSKQKMYLNKIYQILVPQRKNFIIRLQVPQDDIKKQQMSRQGAAVQYIYLPIRQIKSEDLNGDTMAALHQWVTNQLIKTNQYMPFDLIIDKFIIDKLQLPIEVVYHKINQKQVKKNIGKKPYEFMKVIYRIQGLLESQNQGNYSQSSFPRDQKLQTCLNYSSYLLNKIAPIKKTGLDVIMSILQGMKKSDVDKQKKINVLKILRTISMNSAIIKKLIQWQYSDLVINSTVKFFSLQPNEIKLSQVLLEICSKIIKQANEQMISLRKKSFIGLRKQSQLMDIQEQSSQTQSLRTVKYLLQKVKQCQQKDRKDLAGGLINLISFCSKDQMGTSKYLFEFFQLHQNKISDFRNSQKLNWFLQFLQTLSESYVSFKIYCRQNNFTDEIIANIILYVQAFKNLEQKKQIKNLQSLETSLSILKGLIRGDQSLQRNLFEQNIIQEMYRIQKISQQQIKAKQIKVGKMLTLTYELVKYFKEGKIVSPQIQDFIKSHQSENQKKNEQRRKNKLLNFNQRNLRIAQKFQKQLAQQTSQLVCSVCREDYTKKNDVLGAYIYSFKQQIPGLQGWWKQNKRQPGVTSVSYFTPIHFQCHRKAAESEIKIKTQWQGSLIRNGNVKCNGWIGIKGPKTTDEEFQRMNRKYFDKNAKVSFWIPLNDLNGLLQKFSSQYNFSQQTKGSSSTHNSKLILTLLQVVSHYIKKSQEFKYLQQGVKFLQEHMTKRGHLLNLLFCASLFINTYADYQKKKEKYLNLISHLELTDFKQKKKYYIYLGLINEIQNTIHVSMKEQQKIYIYMDKFIPENFMNLLNSFEALSQKYRNIFLKWEHQEQIKEYFSK